MVCAPLCLLPVESRAELRISSLLFKLGKEEFPSCFSGPIRTLMLLVSIEFCDISNGKKELQIRFGFEPVFENMGEHHSLESM